MLSINLQHARATRDAFQAQMNALTDLEEELGEITTDRQQLWNTAHHPIIEYDHDDPFILLDTTVVLAPQLFVNQRGDLLTFIVSTSSEVSDVLAALRMLRRVLDWAHIQSLTHSTLYTFYDDGTLQIAPVVQMAPDVVQIEPDE